MKSKLLVPFVILISFNFSHCKKGNLIDLGIDPADVTLAYRGKLKSIIKKDLLNDENTYSTTFNYTFSGKLNGIFNIDFEGDTTSKYFFQINEDNQISQDTTVLANNEKDNMKVRSFGYDNGKLQKVVETMFPSNTILEYKYNYAYDGSVAKIEVQRIFNGSLLTVGKGEFNWNNGNLVGLIDNLEIGKYEEYEYQYDENENYLNDYLKNEFPLFTFDPAFS